MLEIRSVQMLPDGRAVVETWGAWRFRIVERGTRDGYVVARVERVDDFVEDEDGEGAERRDGEGAVVRRRARGRTNAELMATCHTFLRELREGTPWVVNQLSQVHVPMPADPGAFSFWMGALLPIDEHEKAKLLPIRSARLRLRLVVHWIEQLQSNWARSYASASRLQVVLWWLRRLLMRTLLAGTLPYAFVVALVAVYVAQALVLGAEHAS
ncbi:hypothetical protein WOLCODRAFT_162895 [Wolfiporia cocos MD-104 SS10]|uniref:Lon N-terminal domain-containing protein n=1 Tax=Wolfiporia cocos (strain MD-104) TaxID=742152 RepID=A0A2H3JH52_WOLCO|nr:hypothetical protein WOLCODRAFT_162895 [Wolfiporia cocos MD-104 SS10]